MAGDDHLIRIAEDDPIQALIVFAAERDQLVEIRTRQQDLRIWDMKDFADLDKAFDYVAQTSLLDGEWDDLGHVAIMTASAWLGQLRYNWPEPRRVFDGATPSE